MFWMSSSWVPQQVLTLEVVTIVQIAIVFDASAIARPGLGAQQIRLSQIHPWKHNLRPLSSQRAEQIRLSGMHIQQPTLNQQQHAMKRK